MNPVPDNETTPGLFDEYSTTQKEILAMETKKTRNKLFSIAAVIFIADLIALVSLNAINLTTLLIISVVPVIAIGLAFLSSKEPLLSMIIISVILSAAWIYNFIQMGNESLTQGVLVKLIVIALIFAGFQNAAEAHRIRKEMR